MIGSSMVVRCRKGKTIRYVCIKVWCSEWYIRQLDLLCDLIPILMFMERTVQASLQCYPWLGHFLRLPLSLMTLMILRKTGQAYCRRPLRWDLSDVFLRVSLEFHVWGRKTTHHIMLRLCTINKMRLSVLTLITWLEGVCQFPPLSYSLPQRPSTLSSLQGGLCTALT